MKRNNLILMITFFSTILLLSLTCRKDSSLTVKGGESVIYKTETGEKITAKYYNLSDDSLYFVKVTLPDGIEYTLPQAMSASGVRYTDEREIVWWTKGDTAFVEKRNDQGEWEIAYPDCVEIK